jgi:hypothetical protein
MPEFDVWITAACQHLSAFREATKEIGSYDYFSSPRRRALLDAAFARCLETFAEHAQPTINRHQG